MLHHIKNAWSVIKERKLLPQVGICIALLGFVWFAVFGDQGLYQLHKSRQLKVELKNKIVEMNDKIQNLKNQKDLLNDPAHMEVVIRQELGYIKPGEVVFQKMEP